MAGKTLIGGTAYKISGGKCLSGGTAYKISKGKTLIGGTAYNISFSYLPDEYQQVEYLRVTAAGSFIEDSPWTLANSFDLKAKFRPTPQSSSHTNEGLVQCYVSDDGDGIRVYWRSYKSGSTYTNNLRVYAQNKSNSLTLETASSTSGILPHKLWVSNSTAGSKIYVDGTLQKTSSQIFAPIYLTSNIITWLGKGKTSATESALGDVYYLYYKDSAEEAFLYPCYRKSDNKTGFYDVIGQQFYTTYKNLTIGPVYEGEIDIS